MALGVACQENGQCESGLCIDRVCCNEVCNGACRSCLAASTGGRDGLCAPVSAGTDPDDNCLASPSSLCQTDGACDGLGACRRHPPGTTCSESRCDGNTFTPANTCDGLGGCRPSAAVSCGLNRCGGPGCLDPCAGDDQCVENAYCDRGVCREKKGLGEPCLENRECRLGVCLGLIGPPTCVAP
jgi:hypothetical protein